MKTTQPTSRAIHSDFRASSSLALPVHSALCTFSLLTLHFFIVFQITLAQKSPLFGPQSLHCKADGRFYFRCESGF